MSQQSTLRDQLGVMGIVDQLRHQEQKLADYINARQQQAEIKEKIIAYYQSQGIPVTDTLIEEGVQQWYHRRLQAVPSVLPWYWRAYITRQQWKGMAFTIVGLFLFLLLAWAGIGQAQETYQQAQFMEQVEHVRAQRDAFNAETLPSVPPKEVSDSLLTLSRIDRAQVLTSEYRNAVSRTLPADELDVAATSLSAEDRERYRVQLDEVSDKLTSLLAQQKMLVAAINEVHQARELHQQWQDLGDSHSTLLSRFTALAAQYQAASVLFSSAETEIFTVKDALQNLTGSFKQASLVDEKISLLDTTLDLIIDSGLADQDMQNVLVLHQRLVKQYEQLLPVDSQSLAYLDYVAKVAPLTLTLRVNPQNGPRSAVERTHDNSGDTVAYAITQALDPAGTPVMMMIKDRESGKLVKAQTFGIRLSREKYMALRDDKMQDGIIDDDTLATKPRGSLKLTTVSGVTPEFIIEW